MNKIFLPSCYFGGMMGGVGNMMGWGGTPFTGWLGAVVMLVFWILIIMGVVYLIKYLAYGEGGEMKKRASTKIEEIKEKEDEAVMLLKKRFAKGEIDKVEFEEKMKYLRKL